MWTWKLLIGALGVLCLSELKVVNSISPGTLRLMIADSSTRPSNVSVCDYYSSMQYGYNLTAQQQLDWVTSVQLRGLFGNYTSNNINVTGSLNPGVFDNRAVPGLLSYVDGTAGPTINVYGFATSGIDVQLTNHVRTHAVTFLAEHLGCSLQGTSDVFAKYNGPKSLYGVHEFMRFDSTDIGYFVQELGLSLLSHNVSKTDVDGFGAKVMEMFGHRCVPAFPVVPGYEPNLQSICTTPDCPISPNAVCMDYIKFPSNTNFINQSSNTTIVSEIMDKLYNLTHDTALLLNSNLLV